MNIRLSRQKMVGAGEMQGLKGFVRDERENVLWFYIKKIEGLGRGRGLGAGKWSMNIEDYEKDEKDVIQE